MTFEMNTINDETCIRCARCVNICPMHHLELLEGRIQTVDDPLRDCIACGHCMAVCPTRSIVTKGYDYHDFEDLPDKLPTLDDFLPLLKARRSMRQYRDKPVEKETIESIIDAATTAPFDLPPTDVELTVVQSREKIDEIRPLIMESFKNWVYAFKNPLFTPLLRLGMNGAQLREMKEKIIPLVEKVLEGNEHGEDYLTYGAPAMLLFHYNRDNGLGEQNCVIAMTIAMIAAEGLGLGSCIIGLIPPAIERNREIREMLDIPNQNRPVGCLILGWPRSTYNRSIPREFRSVKWF